MEPEARGCFNSRDNGDRSSERLVHLHTWPQRLAAGQAFTPTKESPKGVANGGDTTNRPGGKNGMLRDFAHLTRFNSRQNPSEAISALRGVAKQSEDLYSDGQHRTGYSHLALLPIPPLTVHPSASV